MGNRVLENEPSLRVWIEECSGATTSQQLSHRWAAQDQAPQQASFNPYKRVPKPPPAEYLSMSLSDSPLGLTDMIPGTTGNQSLWLWMPREDKSPLPNLGSTTKGKATAQHDFAERDSASFTTFELKPTFSPTIVRTPEYYRQNHASTILSPKTSAVAASPVGRPHHSPAFVSKIPVHVQTSILSLEKRRMSCENCRRKKIRCDKSLFQCSQCQRAGVQCTFGTPEPRGRTLHRTRRTHSMPNPPKTDMALTSQLTKFPPPPPFPVGKKHNVMNKKERTKQKIVGSQRVQGKGNNIVKVGQAQGKIPHKQAVPKTSPVSMRPRSLSFHGPTERDPIFGRPFSRPSSRSSSRPSSRPSSIYNSPISAPSPWSKSLASLLEDRIKEQVSPISAEDGFIPSSRLAIPLPLPPVIIAQLRRAARERDWGSVGTNNLGQYTVPMKTPSSSRRTRVRRYSRPPSPHPLSRPSSRPSSRSSFSLPLERRSSFSRYSPGPISAPSSRPSSRPTSRASYSSYSSGGATDTRRFGFEPQVTRENVLPPPVKLKLHYEEDIFVIAVPRTITYDELIERIVGKCQRLCGPLPDRPLKVKYMDEDGDLVSLTSTEDVRLAIDQMGQGKEQYLRIHVS